LSGCKVWKWMLNTGMYSVCRGGNVEWGWLGMQFVLEMRSCRGMEGELTVLCVFADNYCWHTSCLCDCPHLCNTSIITSVATLLRLLDHEDGEMSSHIYQSVWHNIPEDSNLYLSRSNINTKSWNLKIKRFFFYLLTYAQFRFVHCCLFLQESNLLFLSFNNPVKYIF